MKKFYSLISVLVVLSLAMSACGAPNLSNTFRIESGSENKALQAILENNPDNIEVTFVFKGSGDIANDLSLGAPDADAVWPASDLWIKLGDMNGIVKDAESIMRSPIVVACKKSYAQAHGWVGHNTNVSVEDLYTAMQGGLRLGMTTRASNSGTSEIFGFMYAFAGQPAILTSADLQKQEVKDGVKNLLKLIKVTKESSGALKTYFVENYDTLDCMVNYESLTIEANQTLVSQGKEPLYAIYLSDGLAVANSPFGYVDHGDAAKSEQFKKLKAYLLSDAVQQQLLALGRRTSKVGTSVAGANTAVFNPDWGILADATFSPIVFPKSSVIVEALDLYQNELRKPSFSCVIADYSTSMQGSGERDLEAALKQILVDANASAIATSILKASKDDILKVTLFNGGVIDSYLVRGSNPDDYAAVYTAVESHHASGSTNFYNSIVDCLEFMKSEGLGDRSPAVILMTDGDSENVYYEPDGSATVGYDKVKSVLENLGFAVPIYSITYGSAVPDQLDDLAALSKGVVYDGGTDLVAAFQKARSNN